MTWNSVHVPEILRFVGPQFVQFHSHSFQDPDTWPEPKYQVRDVQWLPPNEVGCPRHMSSGIELKCWIDLNAFGLLHSLNLPNSHSNF